MVRLSYLASEGNAVRITVGDTTTAALVGSGVHDLYLQVDGPVEGVRVAVEDPLHPVCVASVQVGTPRPLPPAPR